MVGVSIVKVSCTFRACSRKAHVERCGLAQAGHLGRSPMVVGNGTVHRSVIVLLAMVPSAENVGRLVNRRENPARDYTT